MDITIAGSYVPTSFDVRCSKCEWTGVATIDQPEKLKELSVGEEIRFQNGDKDHLCPNCHEGYIHGISGRYVRNESNHMERVGDYEQ